MKLFSRILCALLLVSLLLTGCTPASTGNETTAPTTNNTEAPTTAPTEAPPAKPTIPAPSGKAINILMIGNSFCYYYVEELVGLASAAGINLTVYNLYYSARSTEMHYNRLMVDKAKDYSLYKTDYYGRTCWTKSCTMEKALGFAEWDVITLQEHFNPVKADTYDSASHDTVYFANLLFDYLKTNYPKADLYWHETWAYEIGYELNNIANPDRMATEERQATNHENIKKVSQEICQQNNVSMIPCGDAWAIARANPTLGQTLCERYMNGKYNNDHYHDGESGGQYLNACVWFEVLFKKSCIGNIYVPEAGGDLEHPLTAEKIQLLQQAAHDAVAAIYGADYAK